MSASRVCGGGAGGRESQTHDKCVAEAARVAAGHDARAILAEAIGGLAVGAAGGLAGSAGGADRNRQARNFHRTDTESFCDQLYATTTTLQHYLEQQV
jgi:hypothetical protein